jgi:hypothetical protein
MFKIIVEETAVFLLSCLTKLDAVSPLQAFCHLERNENATNTCYTT